MDEHEAQWVRRKLKLPDDAPIGAVQGELHVWDSRQHGYMAYIKAFKCDDKQGEIARMQAKIKEMELACFWAQAKLEGTLPYVPEHIPRCDINAAIEILKSCQKE